MIRIRIHTLWQRFIDPLASFFLPALCISCEQPLPSGRRAVCEHCIASLSKLPEAHLQILKDEIEHPAFDDLIVVYPFDRTIQKMIHFFKYQRFLSIADYFAEALVQTLHHKNYDAILAVPLHPVRERERGYNQSALIARSLSKRLNLPFRDRLISRTKNTTSQTKLTRSQRKHNVIDAFTLNGEVKGLRLLLVDDVVTTGSTLNACAALLRAHHAELIDVVAVATPIDMLQKQLEARSSGSELF